MTLTELDSKPLRIGPLVLDVPVVLAPMAGITNSAFRRLCREYGAGLVRPSSRFSVMAQNPSLYLRWPSHVNLDT